MASTRSPIAAGSRLNDGIDIGKLRLWSRVGRQLLIAYNDQTGQSTRRLIWPFMVGYVGVVRVIMAWCELRSDFRIFRADRIREIEFLETRYPASSATLHRTTISTSGAASTATPRPPPRRWSFAPTPIRR